MNTCSFWWTPAFFFVVQFCLALFSTGWGAGLIPMYKCTLFFSANSTNYQVNEIYVMTKKDHKVLQSEGIIWQFKASNDASIWVCKEILWVSTLATTNLNLLSLRPGKVRTIGFMAHNKVCTWLHHLSSFKYSKYKHRALTKQVKNASQHFFNKTKKVNSYNGLQIKFSDCAFKTKKKKKRLKTVHYKKRNQTSLSGTSESWTDTTRRNLGQLR